MRKYYYYHSTLSNFKYCNIISIKQSCNFSTLASTLIQSQEPYLPSPKLRNKSRYLANLLQRQPLSHKQIHAHIIISGLGYDTFIGNFLLSLYSKSGNLRYACRVFDKMTDRNLVTWSSMVSMYTQHGLSEESFLMFLEFRTSCDEGVNEYILTSVIRACTRLSSGDQMHGFVVKCGFDQDAYVGTSLIDYYAKNGYIDEARLVFDGLLERTAVTWTTIITGYVRNGISEVSLLLFSRMREVNAIPDRYVLSSILSACSVLKFIEGGKQIHAYVLRSVTEMDVSVVNVLLDLYMKCGRVQTARKLFDQMDIRDVISWTTMIAGYMQKSFDTEAISLFAEMTGLCWKPDGYACTSVLVSCGSTQDLDQGRKVHAYTIKANFESDSFVVSALIDMYAKCDSLTDARKVFDAMVDHNVICYNAMIEGYSRQEKLSEALDTFREMRIRLFSPTLFTFVSLLGVSAASLALELSKQIHGLIFKFGVALEIFAGSALVDVYAKCSCIKDARLVFEEMNEKDIVVWNAMFFGYTQQMENEEALRLYLELRLLGQNPNDFTFAALITATSNLASLQHGQQFHNQIMKMGLDSDPFIANALIDMYAKCGSFEEARKTFGSVKWRDVVCWNSMISTYAHHGEAEEALHMFDQMIKEGVKPNYVTMVGVLSACSHAGLVEDGLHHFKSMPEFGIIPGIEHYACVVSLLGRAGKLSEAKEFIEKMPIKPAAVVWRSLLSDCRIAGNIEIGKYAAEMAISIDPTDSGSYILLSNIFASKGMWVDVKRVRERMDLDGVVKERGRSWVEVNNEVHVFVARDKTHHEASLIYSILDDLILQLKVVGYVPDTTSLLMID
ncbi:PPR domain-containing protein/PPR_2 domain-containing protein [Cephalotus follicularis]|uniref:PPR domain-containing protein/PPR_2 domain-containing protein n=1 Tax=Cephalotus follicularis TaxID=3775 RepID=A0A1Q3C812_CEPFO|nr:PPR domain-containing protein/PPR_2 domain-containing protein [Cephalotus follicularis]